MYVNPAVLPSLPSCPSSHHPHPFSGEPDALLFNGLALGSWEPPNAAHTLTGLDGGSWASLSVPAARGCLATEDLRHQDQPSGMGRWRPGVGCVPVSPSQSEEELEVGYGRKVAFCAFIILFNPYTQGRRRGKGRPFGPHTVAEQTEVQRS